MEPDFMLLPEAWSDDHALARCVGVSVKFCRVQAGGLRTDRFTDSGLSDLRNLLLLKQRSWLQR